MRTLQDNVDTLHSIILRWSSDPFCQVHIESFENKMRVRAVDAILEFLVTGDRAFEAGIYLAQWQTEVGLTFKALEKQENKQLMHYQTLLIINQLDRQLSNIYCQAMESLTNLKMLADKLVDMIVKLDDILAKLVDTMNEDPRIKFYVEDYHFVAEKAHEDALEWKENYREQV
jgi:hypothetical protein